MIVHFKGKVPKDFAFSSDNEDAFCYSLKNGRAVISDGASVSFHSKLWSNILVKRFLSYPFISSRWLKSVIRSYNRKINYQDLSWAQQAAFSRGSYASLLSVNENFKDKTVDVIAIGDSLAILIKNNIIVDSFPYKTSIEFSQNPELISTIIKDNDFLFKTDFLEKHSVTWSVDDSISSYILLMTDALGAWCLRKNEEGASVFPELTQLRKLSDFRKIINRERHLKSMRIDDSSLIVLSF